MVGCVSLADDSREVLPQNILQYPKEVRPIYTLENRVGILGQLRSCRFSQLSAGSSLRKATLLGEFKFKVPLLQKNLSGELRYYQYDLNDQVKGAQMENHKQLTSGLRYQIYGLKQAGLNQTLIACQIGVNKSTISREFKRNEGIRGWRSGQAQSMRDTRRQAYTNGRQISLGEWTEVERLIQEDLSPEQVAKRLELEGEFRISHETIYQRIYADKRNEGNLY